MRGQEDPHWERRRVEELRARGVSWQHIAQQLGRAKSTLRQLYGERPPAVLTAPAKPVVVKPGTPKAPAQDSRGTHRDAVWTLAVLTFLADSTYRFASEIGAETGCNPCVIHSLVRAGLVKNWAKPGHLGRFQITAAGRSRLNVSQKAAA